MKKPYPSGFYETAAEFKGFLLFFYWWDLLLLQLLWRCRQGPEERFISDFYTHSMRVAKDSVLDGVRW